MKLAGVDASIPLAWREAEVSLMQRHTCFSSILMKLGGVAAPIAVFFRVPLAWGEAERFR